MIDISKLDKCDENIALYNNAMPQGMGWLAATSEPMSKERAQELLEKQTYFDYVQGRVLKVELAGDELDPWLYDRDNGPGAAQQAIDALLVAMRTESE